jgi:hypothetical protein
VTEETQSTEGLSTFSGCFARLFWMGAGNLALFLLVILIAQAEALSVTVYDLVLWGVAAAMVAVRYLDVTRFRGQTTEGQPATLAHWRRYSAGLGIVTGLLWVVAHTLAATRLLK